MARQRTTRPEVVARQEVKHRKGCYSVAAVKRGLWNTPWCPFPPDGQDALVWRDARGSERARARLWVRFRCNDPDCPATILVLGTAICRVAPVGEEVKRASRTPEEQSDGQ